MKISSIIIFLFLFLSSAGQVKKFKQSKKININTYLENIYDSLKQKGITDIITVKRSFSGLHIMDSLGPADYYYIFWQRDTNRYFQKIKLYYDDRMVRTSVKTINKSDIFPNLNKHFNSIKNEELLPFIIKNKINGIDSYSPLATLHQGFFDLTLYSNNETIYKSFEHSYLQDFSPEMTNVNYPYNNSTKLMALWNKLWEYIKNEFP